RNVLGAGEARNRVRLAVERTVPFALLVHTLIIIWYSRHGHDPSDIDGRRASQPWYRSKTEPAFEDMLIKLRRTLIAARFSGTRPARGCRINLDLCVSREDADRIRDRYSIAC
ncbi:MAG: hypothetical protein ACLQDY_21195, partial [Streptosporangiaceae bacterium]